jgi:hypothetical protein
MIADARTIDLRADIVVRMNTVGSHTQMGQVLTGAGWTLKLPEGWTDKREAGQHLLVPPDDGPPVSIRTAKAYGGMTEKDLRLFARDLIEDGYEPEKAKLGDFEGLAFKYLEDNLYARHWYVQSGGVRLEINYDCPEDYQGTHHEVVDKMLDSLAADAGTT